MEQRVRELQHVLRERGVRLTPQRFMILEVLAHQPGHTTAERVLAGVQERYPYVNKTTVYRTLEWLSQLGLVATIHSDANQYEYELLEAPHHHLVCKQCGSAIELPDTTLSALRAVIATQYGFRPCLDHFVLFGICQQCQQQEQARS